MERKFATSFGLLVSFTNVDWSVVKVPGADLLDGLLAVSGYLSSLLWSSFFSKEANSGSVSAALFAPLTMGSVGWIGGGVATGAVVCWRL
jgi:hypothetical protein